MKIVVIGGTGLIGSKVVADLLANGHDVIAASPRTGVNTLTGEGLADALRGAPVVIDVSNAPSWEKSAVMTFFQTSTRNLLAAEAAAGVGHHVALSVVGTERLSASGYFRAKIVQEQMIREGVVPFSIVQATQFFEFLGGIADAATQGETVWLAPVLLQPIAAEDVARAVARVSVGRPLNGTIEIAGPERFQLVDAIRLFLDAGHDPRQAVADPRARYYDVEEELPERTLIPSDGASLGETRLDDWLVRSMAGSAVR
jgi:uncharacterized protein YbjT (DUF2867 family)